MIKRLALVHSHLARFGLEVHIRQNNNPSKVKCVFFPSPKFFDGDHNSTPVLIDGVNEPWLIYQDPPLNLDTPHNATTSLCCSKQESREFESAGTAREDAKYDALAETDKIYIADGYITFCQNEYLGSRISYNLQDDDDIKAQLAAVNQSMGALKEVWRNPHLNMYSKYLPFRSIPMNLLLWGCKNWSL